MKDKIAFVTGGTRGIGKGISIDLAKKCSHVIAGYVSNDDATEKFIAELRKNNIQNVTIFKGDISSPEIGKQVSSEIITKFKKIDILVNNAGITRNGLFKQMSTDDWRKVMSTNLDSLFYVTKPIVDSMIKNHYGRIINISSVNGQKGQYNEVNYSTSKAGIRGFTKALAQELAEYDITVNTVSPGYIDTELTATLPQGDIDKILRNVPVKRLGGIQEVARLVSFLADDESGFITGSDFSINGGLYMM